MGLLLALFHALFLLRASPSRAATVASPLPLTASASLAPPVASPFESMEIICAGDGGKQALAIHQTEIRTDCEMYSPEFLVIKPRAGQKPEIRVEQQDETSLTIPDEGPHLDLTDWKHGVSEWRVLSERDTGKYPIHESLATQFPAYTKDELVAAVKAATDPVDLERWLGPIKDCQPPTCGSIGNSKKTLKISIKEGAQWKLIHRVEINIAMGC